MLRFGSKKIEASQYFGTLGAPKLGEASIFLVFKCKNAGRPQKTGSKLKKIEASQHVGTVRAPKH